MYICDVHALSPRASLACITHRRSRIAMKDYNVIALIVVGALLIVLLQLLAFWLLG
jgi:hypothetical protein